MSMSLGKKMALAFSKARAIPGQIDTVGLRAFGGTRARDVRRMCE